MPAPKRPNYFQSQFLIVRDFQDEQTYHAEMLQLHNLTMHDWGVVRDGLQVTRSGNDYVISRGSAIDSLGRQIVLDDPVGGPPAGKVNQADVVAALAAAGGQDVLITITFREIDSTTDIDRYPPPGGSDNVTRKVQSPVIAVTKAPAAADAVILASILKADGSVDYSARKLASGFVRVGDSNDLFIGPGRNVGIGTTGAPAATLHLGSGTLQIGTAPTSVTTIDTGITHTFNDETTPRYTIDRDLLGNGLAGIGFNTRKVPTSATLAANGSAVGIPTDRALAFSTSDGTSLVERMRIDGTGNVSMARDLKVTGALSVGNGINLNNKPLTLRADNNGPDINHGLAYFGAGASTMGDFAMDGPVLYGSHGGALGTYGTKKVALRWDDSGNVGIGTPDPTARLTVKAGAITFTPSVGGLATGLDLFVDSANSLAWVPSINVGDEVIINNESRRVVAVPGANRIQVDRAFPPTFLKPQMTVIRDADILRMDDRAGNPKFCISANGNIGIGTTNPPAKLTVQQEPANMSSTDVRKLMNTGRPGLVLDLNFRDVDASTFLDFSESRRKAAINQPVTVEAEGTTGYSFEKCASFTGGYCQVPDLSTDYRTGITVEAWVRFRTFSDMARIIDFGNGLSADNIVFTTSGHLPAFLVFQGTQSQQIIAKPGTALLQTNTWTHLAATIDAGGNALIYINGEIVNEGPVWLPRAVNRANSYIGKSNWPDPIFDGWMASLRIYNRNLSSVDIKVDMDADSKGVPSTVTDDMLNKAASGKAVFVCTNTGDGREFDGGVEVRHSSLLQGIGLGYNTIYATGSQRVQSLTIRPRGGGNLILNPKAGNVGIGTSQPLQARLVIRGGAFGTVAPYGWLSIGSTAFNYSGPNSQNVLYSIYADYRVAAEQFNAFSDERIKNVQGRSDSAMDLRTLLSIEVVDFRYKDVIGKGDALHKKVIAQQVNKVFPLAVSKHTDVVPDIYRPAPVTNGWIELATDLKKGDRVKLITEEGEEAVHEVLEVTPDKFRVDFKFEGNQVFVFGREVNDFLNVDYDAISMLNVSATQQLKKEVETLRTEIAELKLANDALMKLQVLESTEASAPSAVVAKNGSNGNGRH